MMPRQLDDQGGGHRKEFSETGQGAVSGSAAEVLLTSAAEVIDEWKALVRPKPWAEIPPPRLVNSLPVILPRLVLEARSGATSVRDDLKELIATEHGSARRQDAVPVAAIAEEWALLKKACRLTLDRHEVPDDEVTRLFDSLDLLMDDALGYTLRGYYKEELDSLRGRGLERRDHGYDRRGSDRSGPGRRRDEEDV